LDISEKDDFQNVFSLYLEMQIKNALGIKKVKGQSEAAV